EVAVTATSVNPQTGVLDNLFSAENVTLDNDFAITVGISQEVVNILADSQNGMEPFTFSITLLSDSVSGNYNAEELAVLMSQVEFDFAGLTNQQGYNVQYDETSQTYVLTATASIPEPTTATLSLLALAALAARRRRK
ncbi:MAG: PEP-CTERM sorting domain-containing protein, partial [Akkermansia sp.]|nr:PEP-CTERM sorting domain-containing protein [Akkermansia sp.]